MGQRGQVGREGRRSVDGGREWDGDPEPGTKGHQVQGCQAFCRAAGSVSVSSQSGLRPIDVNGGEEGVAVGNEEPGSLPEEDEEAIEASEEKRGVIKMADPRQPSEEERREHCLTHLPYRNC